MATSRKYLKILEKDVIKDVLEGILMKQEIEEKYQISNTAINSMMKNHNIDNFKKRKQDKEELLANLIIELNKLGKSVCFISKELKITRYVVYKLLKKHGGIPKTKQDKKYTLDENYFETINTEAKAYFLGLVVSDGCNTRKGLSIGLQEGDEHILKEFAKELNFNGYLYRCDKNRINGKYHYKIIKTLHVDSYKISEDLSKLGCVPAKTHFTYFPPIEEKYYSHFIRGLFDGDGCISMSKNKKWLNYSFSIIGNITLIEEVQKILMKECDLNKTMFNSGKHHSENITSVRYCGKFVVTKIREYLYRDATIYLKRKHEKFYSI